MFFDSAQMDEPLGELSSTGIIVQGIILPPTVFVDTDICSREEVHLLKAK